MFCVTAAAAAGMTFVAPRNAHAADELAFVLYADKAGEFRWRLKAANGEILATSGQGYKEKTDAKAGITRIQRTAKQLKVETYEDAKHEFRWRMKAKNGQVVAASSEGYSERASAEHAVDLVRDRAHDATVTDETA